MPPPTTLSRPEATALRQAQQGAGARNRPAGGRARQPRKDDLPPARLTAQSLREAAALFGYLLPYKGLFAAALACLFLSSLLALSLPYLTGRLIDAAIHPGQEGWFADVNTTTLFLV